MKRSYFKYIIGLLLFGSNGIVANYIALSSYEIVLLRTLIGSLFLIVIFFAGKGKLTFYQHKKQFLWLMFSSIAMGTSWIFLYEAYARIGVSISSLLYYCGPVIVMALSPLLFKEKLTMFKCIGFLSVLGGAFLISGNVLGGKGDTFGILCGLLSAVMYSLMVIFNKKSHHRVGKRSSSAFYQLFDGSSFCWLQRRIFNRHSTIEYCSNLYSWTAEYEHRMLFLFFLYWKSARADRRYLRILRTSFSGTVFRFVFEGNYASHADHRYCYDIRRCCFRRMH